MRSISIKYIYLYQILIVFTIYICNNILKLSTQNGTYGIQTHEYGYPRV